MPIYCVYVSFFLFVISQQKDHERLEKVNAEMQNMEESLQEERMERVKLEVEVGREKDCNRVRKNFQNLMWSLFLETYFGISLQ